MMLLLRLDGMKATEIAHLTKNDFDWKLTEELNYLVLKANEKSSIKFLKCRWVVD